jgi:hypothetical protein
LEDQVKKPHARLMTPRPDAGLIWWGHFVEGHAGEISRRMERVGTIFWTLAERMPIDLFSYFREASHCFTIARYLSAITMASCAVELILNRDSRTRNNTSLRRISGWASLNSHNLIAAANLGLPVLSLCSEGETLQSDSSLLFVQRRNKVAHGEVIPMLKTLSDYDATAEEEAFDQVTKAHRFIVDWFNSAPDVQDGLIVDHKWPSDGP